MAKIKYSALVSDMRNKLNGSVLSKNRYGSYIRNKVTPVNPQSIYQTQARQRLSNLSSAYRSLAGPLITAWGKASANFPFTDIFGDVKHLSGQTLFVKLNSNLVKINQPQISSPPLPAAFPILSIISGRSEYDAQNDYELELTINTPTVPVGFSMVVYATEGLPSSIRFVKNRMRYLGHFTASASKVSLGPGYTTRFGEPLVGEYSHFLVALVNHETGQQSIPFAISLPTMQMP